MAARRTVPANLVHRSEKAVKAFYPAREGLPNHDFAPFSPVIRRTGGARDAGLHLAIRPGID
jgi:hypothetical protein